MASLPTHSLPPIQPRILRQSRIRVLTTQHSSLPPHQKWRLNQTYIQKQISASKKAMMSTQDQKQVEREEGSQSAKRIFFTGVGQTQEKSERSLEKTIKFVQAVRSRRNSLIKLRLATEPSKQKQTSMMNGYFHRQFVQEGRRKKMSKRVMEQFREQSPQREIQKIEERSRKLLLDKMRKDYSNYQQIQSLKLESIKALVESEVARKKKVFREEYGKRYSCPYFSFLSLSKAERGNVLLRSEKEPMSSI